MDVTELLALAVRAGASDLHLAAGEVPALRLEGRLSPLPLPLLMPQHMDCLLYTSDAADE